MISAYPLCWPPGWKRYAPPRRRARFSKGERVFSGDSSWTRHKEVTVADGVARVVESFTRFGVLERGDLIISSNLAVRLDGLPRSGQSEPADPGVAVYWLRPGEPQRCMAIDLYDRVADNLAAIAATLEAMRAIERHGGATILDRAFTGFTALPGPVPAGRPWRDVLGLSPAEQALSVVEGAYKRARQKSHPDHGGSAAAFQVVTEAWEQACRELG